MVISSPVATLATLGKVKTILLVDVAITPTMELVEVSVLDAETSSSPLANEPFTVSVELGAVVPMPTLPLLFNILIDSVP